MVQSKKGNFYIERQNNGRPFPLPTTRYVGSKAKIVDWIWEKIKKFEFDTFLDAFGGTGVVSYYAKRMGKKVIYNDILKFNYIIGKALIENNTTRLPPEEFIRLTEPVEGIRYKSVIAENFRNIYYTDEENRWLDRIIQNIEIVLDDEYKKAIAYYVVFQACMIKRPFSLFHRKNLYLRQADVKRTFGNKTSWDTPFEVHCLKFLKEINSLIYDNGRNNMAFNSDVLELNVDADVVYLDPPYTDKRGVSVDYRRFYHFLEGMLIYDEWEKNINRDLKNKPLKKVYNPWSDKKGISSVFRRVVRKFSEAVLVISYRSDGIPPINKIRDWVAEVKEHAEIYYYNNYKYALSRGRTSEVLIIGY